MLEMLMVAAIFAVLIAVFMVMLKKTQEKENALIESLSREQITELQRNNVTVLRNDKKSIEWTQKAVVCEIVDKGNKYSINGLWFNSVLQNGSYNKLCLIEKSAKKEEFNGKGIKEGDLVKMYACVGKNKTKFEIVEKYTKDV